MGVFSDNKIKWTAFWVYFIAIFLGAFSAKAFGQPVPEPVPLEGPVDKILVVKSERKLYLIKDGETVREYFVALGGNPVGHKEREGDMRTPEGTYRINGKNSKSKFHRSLVISYPNDEDRARAREQGVDPGGDIMIHGLPNDWAWVGSWHVYYDWTQGCIALTNQEIDEINEVIRIGTPIEIQP